METNLGFLVRKQMIISPKQCWISDWFVSLVPQCQSISNNNRPKEIYTLQKRVQPSDGPLEAISQWLKCTIHTRNQVHQYSASNYVIKLKLTILNMTKSYLTKCVNSVLIRTVKDGGPGIKGCKPLQVFIFSLLCFTSKDSSKVVSICSFIKCDIPKFDSICVQ